MTDEPRPKSTAATLVGFIERTLLALPPAVAGRVCERLADEQVDAVEGALLKLRRRLKNASPRDLRMAHAWLEAFVDDLGEYPEDVPMADSEAEVGDGAQAAD